MSDHPIVHTEREVSVTVNEWGCAVLRVYDPRNSKAAPAEYHLSPDAVAVVAVQSAQVFCVVDSYPDATTARDMCRAMFGVGQVRHNMDPIKFERR